MDNIDEQETAIEEPEIDAIQRAEEGEYDLENLPKPEPWTPIFTRDWFDLNILGISWKN